MVVASHVSDPNHADLPREKRGAILHRRRDRQARCRKACDAIECR